MVPNGTTYTEFPSFADSGTRVKPTPDAKYAQGFVPGDTYPAEWQNYFMHGATAGISRLNTDTESIKKELNSILAAYSITNNADAFNQLLTVLGRIYPQICTCDTAAATEVKAVAITGDGVILKAGNIYSITMTYGNEYGNGSTTYPKLSINSGTAYPLCDSRGVPLKAGAWAAGDAITVLFTGSKYLMASQGAQDKVENANQAAATVNAVSCVLASSATITGAPALGTGGAVRVMFTDNIAGTDTTTALAISYNGTAYTLKVSKDGALQNIYAHEIATNIFRYIQKYTTLELVYDGTNLIVIGNPIVLSGTGYTIYADGYNSIKYANDQNDLSDWEDVTYETVGGYPKHTMTYDGFIMFGWSWGTPWARPATIISKEGNSYSVVIGGQEGSENEIYLRQGDAVWFNGGYGSPLWTRVRYYKNRDYSNR